MVPAAIDCMQTDELRKYLEANWPLLKTKYFGRELSSSTRAESIHTQAASREGIFRNSYRFGQVVSTGDLSIVKHKV